MRHQFMKQIHFNLQHPGIHRFTAFILEFATWKNIYKDCKFFCQNCTTCQQSKRTTVQYSKLQSTTINESINSFNSVALDLVGPLPISRDASSGIEYKYILTCIDISSRYVE